MPNYVFECFGCLRREERVFSVRELPERVACEECEGEMRVIIVPGLVVIGGNHPVWEEYKDENLGVVVKSREHRREEMKRRGLEDKSFDKRTYLEKVKDLKESKSFREGTKSLKQLW